MNPTLPLSLMDKLVARLGPAPYSNHLSPAQARAHAKAEATAPARLQAAEDIKAWNATVKRRNQRFATTGLCRDDRIKQGLQTR